MAGKLFTVRMRALGPAGGWLPDRERVAFNRWQALLIDLA